MSRDVIHTDQAPAAIGVYSQAVKCGNTVYLSGQVALDPQTAAIVPGGIEAEIHQVFKNLAAVAKAAGGSLKNAAKLTIYVTDMGNFPKVNEIMAKYFDRPYPARATVGVAALPKNAQVEIDAVLVLE
jgi:reactive intermediate/imine deaminase